MEVVMIFEFLNKEGGGVVGPTQRPCVYLLVEGTTWHCTKWYAILSLLAEFSLFEIL